MHPPSVESKSSPYIGRDKIIAPGAKRVSWRGLSSGIDLKWPIIARGGGETTPPPGKGVMWS